MSRAGKIARRTLLIGTVAIAGGIAFGAYMVRRDPANPLAGDLAEGEAALTPYVKITGEGITLITPRADSGQGAYSVQAALIAEELDVELDQIAVDPGEPSAAYWNTALAGEAVPFAFYDDGFGASAMRGAMGAAVKLVGLQLTGGSTTVPDAWEKLRLAGASARETLKEAAARRLGVARNSLTTEAGEVVAPDGTRIAYTDLAAEAAAIEPVAWEGLRGPSEWRLIGKPMRRIDIVAKSTGTEAYGIDRRMEGMLFGTVVTNPHLGGELISMDAAEAETMPGVDRVVRFANGAGVLASNTWTAIQAARAIRFDWGPPAIPAEQEDHWRILSESFTEDRQDSRFRDDGDVEAAEASVEAEYRAPYLAHAPMEPLSATVLYTEDRIDIWTGTQIPRFIQTNVTRMTGIEDVRVHVEVMGGSFGHRLEDDYVQNAVRLAMAVPGTPVLMTYSREEDMAHDFPRQIAMARGRGAVADGRIESFDLSIAMPSLTDSQMGRQGQGVPGPDLVIAFGAFDQPYAIPSYRMTGYRAPDLAPVSSWRSVGASTNVFFHETLFDELAHAAGADPLEERLRLMDHGPSRDVLEAVGEMCGWSGPDAGDGRFRGIAYGASFGVPVAEVVEVSAEDGLVRIHDVWVAANVGRVVDPVNFENHVQGGVVWGLGHAMNCEITFAGGAARQTNYHAHEGMRLHQCPRIEVRGLETNPEVKGIGEPPVPPAAPALANAIFAATGTRLREMPFDKHVSFA